MNAVNPLGAETPLGAGVGADLEADMLPDSPVLAPRPNDLRAMLKFLHQSRDFREAAHRSAFLGADLRSECVW
jgi:hypothetical protein